MTTCRRTMLEGADVLQPLFFHFSLGQSDALRHHLQRSQVQHQLLQDSAHSSMDSLSANAARPGVQIKNMHALCGMWVGVVRASIFLLGWKTTPFSLFYADIGILFGPGILGHSLSVFVFCCFIFVLN